MSWAMAARLSRCPNQADETISVLFMQTQSFFGADSQIHASIMRHLDPSRFDIHCAVPYERDGEEVASTRAVERLTDATLKPTKFGPSLDYDSKSSFVLDLLRSGPPAALSLVGLARHARRSNISIVHCTEKPRDVVYGMLIARACGAACVIHVHVKAENWIRSVVLKAMHRASALIGVSEFVAESIRDLGYEPSKVHAVLNGLELDEWIDEDDRSGEVRSDVLSEFGLDEDAPLLVTASRLYRYKGQHRILAALPAVKLRHPGVKLLIVGVDDPRGADSNQSYTAELRALCEEYDLVDDVIFTGYRSDVKRLMTASDLFVMPSFEEPFGMVFTEAMALRTPVVASNNGGTKEVVIHAESGLLSESEDTEQLGRDMITLLDDPDLRRRMGEKGRQRVVDALSSERMASDVAAVYESLAT
jgi:glycosyltransferase involved in cell wall biosynthesis